MLLLTSTSGQTLHLQINCCPFVKIEVALPKILGEGLEISTCSYAQSQGVVRRDSGVQWSSEPRR